MRLGRPAPGGPGRHSGATPSALPRAASAAVALLLCLPLPACTGTGSAPAPPDERPSTPLSATADAVGLCVRLVGHWAADALRGGRWSGLDWEQKGLSNGQYALHEEIVAAARTEERRRGRTAALELIARRTREGCTARNGATEGSQNWRPPGEDRSPSPGP
ncbi:hypothetical protein [Streptomyces yaizuensis]|uniref:Lipoprotein n=1 Tax=Streptomyces yaizuensis TaxID=2989713 RepID=A0ABQ5P7H7_9ACTN|nr:hypothetical protein [Streptomyces sp. YSPA8]GLF98551.1 hypothetical protein SYYSPA8_29660 [Streptomyces sp. YSPA8]